MQKALEEIGFLSYAGRHMKSGHLLRELTYADMTAHLHAEVSELYYAVRDVDKPDPNAILELADVLCIAFHFAVRQGWTLEQIEHAMLNKLMLRFEVEPEYEQERQWRKRNELGSRL